MEKNQKNYRVFLSYRGSSSGDTRGKEFEEALYEYLTDDPACETKYGRIYYSPEEEHDNFIRSISDIMESVEYFVMPLTRGFFDDFWDEKENRPNSESITYMEIQEAISKKSKFVFLTFEGFQDDIELYKKLFGDNYTIFSAAKTTMCTEENKSEIISGIASYITVPGYYSASAAFDLLNGDTPNVRLQTKRDTEDAYKYPLYKKLQGAKRISLLNYASTSLLSGIGVSSFYTESDYMRNWFSFQVMRGEIEADVVLTDPFCYAATDAASYKMCVSLKRGVKTEQIILKNIMNLYEFKRKYPSSRVNLFLTTIALPYGIMMTEHENKNNNHMKIDMYAAVTGDDAKRPSFYLLERDEKTHNMYEFYRDNFNAIKNHNTATRKYDFSNSISCFINHEKPIIHRGMLNADCSPHTELSFLQCIEKKRPIEVDLLQIKGGKIIVGRDDFDLEKFGIGKRLSQCNLADIRTINQRAEKGRLLDKILLLDEFLNLIGGKIPVMLEIKIPYNGELSEQEGKYVDEVLLNIENYLRRYNDVAHSFCGSNASDYSYPIAVHSSNPYVVRHIKQKNCMIACGIVTTDFSKYSGTSPEFVYLHKSNAFLDIVDPDYISYDIRELGSESYYSLKDKYDKPVLAWTIKNEEDKEIALSYCDNVIQEGMGS